MSFCDVPGEGYAGTDSDCDDLGPAVYPGAVEVCDDTVDNDCDTDIDEGCGLAALSDAIAFVEGTGNGFAYRVAGGDLTGDGVDDLVVGAYIEGTDYEGRAYVFSGPLSGQTSVSAAVGWVDGTVEEGALGYRVDTTEDLDGDGVDDLLVGALGLGGSIAKSNGTAYLVTDVPIGGLVVPDDARAWFVGPHLGSNGGSSVADVGDMNGDGILDVAIGAAQAVEYGGGAGHVYLLHGPVSGAYNLKTDADVTLYGDDWAGGLGDTVASGDLTGDGLPDLIVAANSSSYAGAADGAVFVVSDPSSSMVVLESDADARVVGTPYTSFGQVAVVGDFTGDGHPDLAASDGASPGTVFVVPGPLEGELSLATAHAVIDGLGTYLLDMTGQSLEVTDLNRDGAEDLAIGSPHISTTTVGPGAVDVFYGPLSSGTYDLTSADIHLAGSGSDQVGVDIRQVGDTSGDGIPELAVTSNVWSGGLGGVWILQ